VFTSLTLLWQQMDHGCRSVLVAGDDLLDVLLPALTGTGEPIGVFLDLGAAHQLSLPAELLTPTLAGGV
jgi:hypothetical protein